MGAVARSPHRDLGAQIPVMAEQHLRVELERVLLVGCLQ